MIHSFKDKRPDIHESCFVADNASVIGNVKLMEDCSVWFGAVVRGDTCSILIGSNTNIQDNCTIHGDKGFNITVGQGVTIGHNAIIHGCSLGDNVLVGMGAIIMNGACIGSGTIIAAGAVVTEGQVVPNNSLVVGVPAKVIKTVSPKQHEIIQWNALHYAEISKEYMK